jgi:acetoin utilization protein AcuB
MIVRDIMTTKLITISPDDTLSHAANLLRQYQFHHLPVVRTVHRADAQHSEHETHRSVYTLEGVLTSSDIDVVVAVARQNTSSEALKGSWQERRVVEVMHHATICVTPTTTVAAAAKILVERGLNYLPIVEYEAINQETKALLVGLLTRSDLLITFVRSMGAFEPGMQLEILLPMGDMMPLATALKLAADLHMPIRSVIAAPTDGVPSSATLRLGTINPAPLLLRLQEVGIQYTFADPLGGEELHV